MSRSKRKTPITGATTASSDKSYKVREHRRERRTVKAELEAGNEAPHPKTFGDPWNGDKDGKLYRDEPTPKDLRK